MIQLVNSWAFTETLKFWLQVHICPSIRQYSPFSLISYIDNYLPDHQNERLPQWLGGKESASNTGATGDTGCDPCVGKTPWRRKWQPTPVFLPGESHGQRSLAGYSPWGSQRVEHDWSNLACTQNGISIFRPGLKYWVAKCILKVTERY